MTVQEATPQWRLVDEGWGRLAADFATLSEPANCREYVALHHQLKVDDGDRLLDVACGSGLAIELDVSGLPPSPRGFYYQAWMKGSRGLVTIGTFHLRGGPGAVELWSAVSLTDYPAITVTREPEDGNPASSGQVVLTNHP